MAIKVIAVSGNSSMVRVSMVMAVAIIFAVAFVNSQGVLDQLVLSDDQIEAITNFTAALNLIRESEVNLKTTQSTLSFDERVSGRIKPALDDLLVVLPNINTIRLITGLGPSRSGGNQEELAKALVDNLTRRLKPQLYPQ